VDLSIKHQGNFFKALSFFFGRSFYGLSEEDRGFLFGFEFCPALPAEKGVVRIFRLAFRAFHVLWFLCLFGKRIPIQEECVKPGISAAKALGVPVGESMYRANYVLSIAFFRERLCFSAF
jgi:hypothetical protein